MNDGLMTKEQAMRKYGIDDLRKFNTKDFIKVMSSLDKMDPEVVKELIAQIPNFLSFATEASNSIKESFEKTLSSDNDSLKSVYASYDLIIETLTSDLKDGDLSLDEKLQISHLIADFIHAKEEAHFKQQQKRHDLFKTFTVGVAGVAIAVLALLSGGEITKGKDSLPKHDDNDNHS